MLAQIEAVVVAAVAVAAVVASIPDIQWQHRDDSDYGDRYDACSQGGHVRCGHAKVVVSPEPAAAPRPIFVLKGDGEPLFPPRVRGGGDQ